MTEHNDQGWPDGSSTPDEDGSAGDAPIRLRLSRTWRAAHGTQPDQPAERATTRPGKAVADAGDRRADASKKGLIIGVATGAVALTAAALITVAVGSHHTTGTPDTAVVTTATTVTGTAAETPTTAAPRTDRATGSPDGATPLGPDAQALLQLEAAREETLRQYRPSGRWVAQLASKYPGITDVMQTNEAGGHTFSAADIWSEHETLRVRIERFDGSRVRLLLSTDYGSRQRSHGHPLWVSFAPLDAASAETVQAWCAAVFPRRTGSLLASVCLPRVIAATG